MTLGDIYKQFRTDYPEMEVKDYRPFAEYYLPDDAIGIIVWLKNGDVLVYIPKEVGRHRKTEENSNGNV